MGPVTEELCPHEGVLAGNCPAVVGSPLAARLASGLSWSLAAAVGAQTLALAASIASARLLGKTIFGELAMIQSTTAMFGVLAGMGLGLTATRHVAQFRTSAPERAGRIIALSSLATLAASGVTAMVAFAAAPAIAAGALGAPRLAGPLRLSAALLLLNAANGSQTGALAGLEAFRTIALTQLLRGALTLPLLAAGIGCAGLTGAVLALTAAAAAGCIATEAGLRCEAARAGLIIAWRGAWAERRLLWEFSVPAFLGSALAGPVSWAANTILISQPGGYAEMALFNAASQWRSAIAFLPASFTQPLIAMLSYSFGTADRAGYRRLYRLNLCAAAILSAAAGAAIIAAGGWIASAYGPQFNSLRMLLPLVAGTAVLSAIAAAIGNGIASLGRMWWGLGLNAIWAAPLIAFSWWLAPRYQALGLAAAMFGAYLLHTGVAWLVAGRAFAHGFGEEA